MFGRNSDKLKTNSALKALYWVKHPVSQPVARAAGVCPAFSSSAHAAQGRRFARDCPAPSTCDTKQTHLALI